MSRRQHVVRTETEVGIGRARPFPNCEIECAKVAGDSIAVGEYQEVASINVTADTNYRRCIVKGSINSVRSLALPAITFRSGPGVLHGGSWNWTEVYVDADCYITNIELTCNLSDRDKALFYFEVDDADYNLISWGFWGEGSYSSDPTQARFRANIDNLYGSFTLPPINYGPYPQIPPTTYDTVLAYTGLPYWSAAQKAELAFPPIFWPENGYAYLEFSGDLVYPVEFEFTMTLEAAGSTPVTSQVVEQDDIYYLSNNYFDLLADSFNITIPSGTLSASSTKWTATLNTDTEGFTYMADAISGGSLHIEFMEDNAGVPTVLYSRDFTSTRLRQGSYPFLNIVAGRQYYYRITKFNVGDTVTLTNAWFNWFITGDHQIISLSF